MRIQTLSTDQLAVVDADPGAKIFLEGRAGSGKTTTGVERMLALMQAGVPGESILVLVPQRTLGLPYYEALRTPGVQAGGMVTVLTIGGLARRMVELFWPLVAKDAGFAHPNRQPVFLTLETAQYYMARTVQPLLAEGYFDSVTLNRNRLYSQIIDNLNKAAVVGFPYSEIAERLKGAWVGEPGQVHIYDDAQVCASRFREYCLAHNLLDFSLQLEVFHKYLWPLRLCRKTLLESYSSLIVDNIEEDIPITHDVLGEWLPECASALVIYDQDGGYRHFLGADPESGYRLAEFCATRCIFKESFVNPPSMAALGIRLQQAMPSSASAIGVGQGEDQVDNFDPSQVLEYGLQRYFPEMLDWVAQRIAELVHDDGVSPDEIVVLAPFLSDALRFSLAKRLEALQIPTRTHRPSRSLRDEPVTLCLLTLAALAHPDWEIQPSKFDVAYALVQAVGGLDIVRGQLLTEIIYHPRPESFPLTPFDRITNSQAQRRITFHLGEKVEHLRLWLEEYSQGQPFELDYFFSQLFGEVLSQPGYGFHADYSAGEVTAKLIESVQKFRWAAAPALEESGIPVGQEYLKMVQDGVIAAQYLLSWREEPAGAVLLAPAYTFLMSNRPVDFQFWLSVGSRGWFERLYQPLTHPYVLSRRWTPGRAWSEEDDFAANMESLRRLALGLIHRCRRGIFLGLSELNEQGYESRGPLLQAFQRLLRRSAQGGGR